MPMLETVWYQNKGTQSRTGMLRYWTEIQDAGVPMLAASILMPMLSNGYVTALSRAINVYLCTTVIFRCLFNDEVSEVLIADI
jgi:hypothetical protein